MPLVWSNLKQYKCPLCSSDMKDKIEIHVCSNCNFSISDQKLSNMVVLRHRPLDPPEFIKEMRKENKHSIIGKLWKTLWKS